MKKILFVITLESSAENFISDQLSYFREKAGFECHLICSPHPRLEQYVESQGASFLPVKIERQLSLKDDIKAYRTIRKYMRKQKFDVLIAHSFPKACLLSMTAGRFAGIPHRVELAHGALQEGLTGIMKKIVILCERHNSSWAEKVISVSPSVIQRRLLDKIDKPNKQVLLSKGTSNGVDALNKFNPNLVSPNTVNAIKEKYHISDTDFVIGFCGRLVHDKGVTELVDGFKLLQTRHPNKSIKLLIIGDPEMRDALPQQTLDCLTHDDNIIFTGRIPYVDIQQYYMPMNVFILPSYREGFPTVVLEASAMAKPVVTTRKTGCIDSIVEGETGQYCEIEATSIADSIEPFFDEVYAKQMGQNGREWVVRNFDHTIVREALLQFINDIVKE